MENLVYNTMAWTANFCFLGSYFLVSKGYVSGEGVVFNILNLSGSLLYCIYATFYQMWPVLILDVIWACIALAAFWRIFISESKYETSSN
jgi:hypothetical protein